MLEIEKKKFKNPESQYRLAPFWFWNHDLTDKEILWQIQEMNRQGAGGFIMHARYGLITPYMSDEWLDRCETAVKEAARLNMKVYLYDEFDFPSGTAGGRVAENNNEFINSALILSHELKVKGETCFESELKTADGVVAVLAVPLVNDRIINFPEGVLNLQDSIKGNHLKWKSPKGEWLVIIFARKFFREGPNRYMVDYMNRGAIAKFIELTHVRYRERFGKYFGNVIVGIFTDEPGTTYIEPGVPWTKALPEEFSTQHGYDLIPILPALFKETGPKSEKFRCDFWETVTRLYSESYFKQIWEFCDSCNLKFVGHVSSEDQLFLQARRQGDFFRCSRWMHFGGCDYLSSKTWPRPPASAIDFSFGSMNNLLSPKFASSAAHIYNKPRTMSETFAIAGQWGVTLRTLKQLSDWQVALGVNLLMPHAFYYTILGFRKWEAAPGEFYQSPFWTYYKIFADYCGRLCSLFSGGEHMVNVAVLYPIKSMWSSNISLQEPPGKEADGVVLGLTKLTKSLLRIHHDFDIIPEELLQEASVSDTIRVCDSRDKCLHEFKALVIPPSITLSRKTLERIKEFYDHGGTVILTGMVPNSTPEGNENKYPLKIFQSIFRDKLGTVNSVFVSNQNGGNAVWLPGIDSKSEDMIEKLLSGALEPKIEPQVRITEKGKPIGDIICLKYRKTGADFYFLVNTSTSRTYDTQITLNSLGSLNLWDARTGQIDDIQEFRIESGQTILNMPFEPSQSYIISVSGKPKRAVEANVVSVETKARSVITLSDSWNFSTDKPNALPLTDWQMRFEAGLGAPSFTGETNPDFCEGRRMYQTNFQIETKVPGARLLFDGLVGENCLRPFNLPFTVKMTLNGFSVENFQEGRYLDHLMKETKVGHLLRRGVNELVVIAKPELYEGGNLGHPPLLLGDFSLQRKQGEWAAIAPIRTKVKGSWTEFGYPFYSGIGTYTQEISIPRPKTWERFFLRFEALGDLAEVRINGKSAGVVAWEPFEVDITRHIKPGKNRVEIKVANSLQNLFVLTPRPSGILGNVEVIAREEK